MKNAVKFKTLDELLLSVKEFVLGIAKRNHYKDSVIERIEKVPSDIQVYYSTGTGERIIVRTSDGYGSIITNPALASYYGKPLFYPTIIVDKSNLGRTTDGYLDNNIVQIVAHEFIHALSDNFYAKTLNKSGFRIDDRYSEINEGMTEYLTEQYLNNINELLCNSTIYPVSNIFAKLLVNSKGVDSEYVNYYFSDEIDEDIFGESKEFFMNFDHKKEKELVHSEEKIMDISEKIINREIEKSVDHKEKILWYRQFLEDEMFISDIDAISDASSQIQIKGEELCTGQ